MRMCFEMVSVTCVHRPLLLLGVDGDSWFPSDWIGDPPSACL